MVIIAYEGKTDKTFLDDFLKYNNLNKDKATYYNFEGKDSILNSSHKYYDEIEKDLNKITNILLIIDADYEADEHPHRGYKNSEQGLKKLIEDLDFNIPIDYYIMCNENKEGNLESFLLSTFDDKQQECIKQFKKCYKEKDKWIYNTLYKNNNNNVDFSHPNFTELKEKLTTLFKNGI